MGKVYIYIYIMQRTLRNLLSFHFVGLQIGGKKLKKKKQTWVCCS